VSAAIDALTHLRDYQPADLPPRIASKIRVDENGCWLWTATGDGKGYGFVRWQGANRRVHRVVYGLLVGEPQEQTLDHLCRVKACCNPAHLEDVSHRVNILRGGGLAAQAAGRTHCPQGHAYDATNTKNYRGRRYCRACHLDHSRAYRRRLADAAR
jgi:hypothetical protein